MIKSTICNVLGQAKLWKITSVLQEEKKEMECDFFPKNLDIPGVGLVPERTSM